MEKVCNTCKTSKPISEYRGRKQCKSCENKDRYKRNKLRKQTDQKFYTEWKAKDVERKRRKERENPMTGFIQIMRVCVRKGLSRKGYTKKSRAYEILGAEWDFVKNYIESMFKEGMTWENQETTPIFTFTSDSTTYNLCVGIYDVEVWNAMGDTMYYDTVITILSPSTHLGFNELTLNNRELIRVVDMMGRETKVVPNKPLIYVYSDGSKEIRYITE
jgi:hypothetical protein